MVASRWRSKNARNLNQLMNSFNFLFLNFPAFPASSLFEKKKQAVAGLIIGAIQAIRAIREALAVKIFAQIDK